jgi:uncharacterized protein YqgV (UPF0045/DUF77 family)
MDSTFTYMRRVYTIKISKWRDIDKKETIDEKIKKFKSKMEFNF